MTINVNCPPRGLFIGHETENGARALTVDFSAWAAEYSTGTLQILFQRPGTESPYAVVLTRDGTTATWKPSETDLAEAGTGAVQIIYTVGDVRVKTSIIPVMVEPSLGVETDPPEGWTSWIDQLTDLAAETEQHAASAAESAENAGTSAEDAQQHATEAGDAKTAAIAAAEAAAASVSHYPQIVGGVWYVWSPAAGAYVSTGIDAQGEDGVSPTVEITAIQGGHRVVITDAEGSHTFDVLDGVTPDLSAYRTAADQDVIDDAQDNQITDLKSALNTKAGILRDTVSGSVASFVPDITVPNLLGLDVHLEPIQDLHGYDSPWPAGGGVNLLYKPQPKTQTINGVSWSLNEDGSVTANGTASGVSTFTYMQASDGIGVELVGNFRYKNFPVVSQTIMAIGILVDKWVSIYPNYASPISNVNGKIHQLWFQIKDGQTADNITIYPMIYADGASVDAWTPFENLCPISGRESVEVEATGINVWDEEWEEGYYGSTGKPSGGFGYIRSKNYISVKPSTSYYCHTGTASNFCLQFYGENKEFLSQNYNYRDNVVVTPSNCYYLRFWRNEETYNNDISINYPSTDHDYHPYVGTTNTIQLGDTVYGGTLDVTGGKMYARPYFPSYNGQALVGPWVSSMDAYTPGASPTVGAQVVDMGGAVTEITLDPVTIATIANQTNNVWADAGDVTVEYAADLKTYIDNKIAAAVAALS